MELSKYFAARLYSVAQFVMIVLVTYQMKRHCKAEFV